MKILEILTDRRRTGNVGEAAAARYLKKHGYKILKRNYVAVGYEIDIIARDKKHTVFCEVKARTVGHESPKEPRPASSVTPEKQRKIITTAKYYNGGIKSGRKMRFDVIEVFLDERRRVISIKHLESAFNLNTAHSR